MKRCTHRNFCPYLLIPTFLRYTGPSGLYPLFSVPRVPHAELEEKRVERFKTVQHGLKLCSLVRLAGPRDTVLNGIQSYDNNFSNVE